MKKFVAIIAAIILLTSCGIESEQYEILEAKDVFLVYPAENVRAFTVDDDGILYTYEDDFLNFTGDMTINAYDLGGQKIESYEVKSSGSIMHICIGENNLYFTVMAHNKQVLYSYDMEKREQKELIALDSFSTDSGGIKKIAYLNNHIYIAGVDPGFINKEYDLWEGDKTNYDPYIYDGTVLSAYNLGTGGLEIIFNELPNLFSLTPEGKIMLLAYDSEGGVYFAEFDPESRELGNKRYFDDNSILSFAADKNGVVINSLNASKLSAYDTLSYLPLKSDSGVADLMPNVFTVSIIYKKGFTFYLNNHNGKIERIKNSVYIKNNPKIKMISPGRYSMNIFSSGYSIEFTELNYDEFALTALSRDKRYDICYMSSSNDFALNIKNNGSFYPLNNVPGVKEFIDACFPFIKEAAINEDGDIWMLPIYVSAPAFIYHEENSKNAGFDFGSISDIFDAIEIGIKAREIDQNLFWFNSNTILHKSILIYLRDNTTLDTPKFRQLAASLKDFMTKGEPAFGNSSSLSDFAYGGIPGFLFLGDDFGALQRLPHITTRNDLSVTPFTGKDNKNSAYSVFICVNPDSNNLKTTLEYISALCEYMLLQKDSFLFADISKYTASNYAHELYKLYENSVIDFNVSNEIFASDFDKYLRGEINLDNFIIEAGRKLTMYLNE
jgi:hypothetical protein